MEYDDVVQGNRSIRPAEIDLEQISDYIASLLRVIPLLEFATMALQAASNLPEMASGQAGEPRVDRHRRRHETAPHRGGGRDDEFGRTS